MVSQLTGVFLGGLSAFTLQAIPVELTLSEDSGYVLEYSITNQGADQHPVTVTGSMSADIIIDPTGTITDFHFTGGRMAVSDATPSFTFGSFPIQYTAIIESRGLAFTARTITGSATIDSAAGTLIPEAHAFIYNEGTNTTIGKQSSFLGTTEIYRDLRDFTARPENVPLTPLTTVSLTYLEPSPTLPIQAATIELRHQPTDSRKIPLTIPGTNFELEIFENGSLIAEGEVILPQSLFTTWAEEGGIALSSPWQQHPETGQSLILLYALGHLPHQRVELSFEKTASGPEVILSLPSHGCRYPVAIEFSKSLIAEDWQQIALLQPGDSGLQRIAISGLAGFARVTTLQP